MPVAVAGLPAGDNAGYGRVNLERSNRAGVPLGRPRGDALARVPR
ncbi:hypothetical protein [Frankia sp. CiP3]|nr:hypothetical protein [Frankia sp. CiP3]